MAWILVACMALAPTVALGLDAKREAAVEYVAAQEASRAGNPKLALHHALQAWQLDPAMPEYALLVAHIAERAEELEQAERAYQAWLALANRDMAGDPAVQQALARVRNRRQAQKKADEAAQQAAAGDHGGAARLYGEARALDPEHLEYLQAEGIQALEAGERERALGLLRAYLSQAPDSAQGRSAARQRLRELGEATSEPDPRPDLTKSEFTRRDVGFWCLVGGGALAVSAGGLWFWSRSEQSLADAYTTTNAMSYSEFEDHRATASGARVAGVATTVLAAGALGAGAWLYWWAPSRASVALVGKPDGLAVVGRF